jgi:ADP-ribose pyrophosphatase YjhB (NUDIX family)
MRYRGTAVVIRSGKILLVRDKGHHKFSLPGGKIKKGEPTVSAATRELHEELGLSASKTTRVRDYDFKGSTNIHKVCIIEAYGEPHLRGHELDKFIWWDMKTPVQVYTHVTHIVKKINEEKYQNTQYWDAYKTKDNQINYFSILGIEPNATKDEIKNAYRHKMHEYHPDMFMNQPEWVRKEADKMSKILNKAYETLMNKK